MGFKLEKKGGGEKTGVFVEKGKRLVSEGGVGGGEGRGGRGLARKHFKSTYSMEKGNCAYKRNTVSLAKLLIWPFN